MRATPGGRLKMPQDKGPMSHNCQGRRRRRRCGISFLMQKVAAMCEADACRQLCDVGTRGTGYCLLRVWRSVSWRFLSQMAGRYSQSSSSKLSIRLNSLVLWVTRVKLFARAMAAICIS